MSNEAPAYDREEYIRKWALMFKCKPEVFTVASCLVNGNKNYQSAAALIFGLSWVTHKEWLNRCSVYWKEAMEKFPAGTKVDAKWCYEFQQHYIKDVAKYPS